MDFLPELWYLFPASIAIATVAMASGVGGAIFFSPLFILVLGLEPQIAIGTALFTELFGFSSGLFAYSRNRLIDYKLGISILKWSVPSAILGTLLISYVSPDLLKGGFALGIAFIGIQIFRATRQEQNEKHAEEHDRRRATTDVSDASEEAKKFESTLTSADGQTYHYTVCNRKGLRWIASIGGATVGLISVGLGEMMDYQLISKCKVPSPVAVATAVFCVVVTVLVASLGHFYEFAFHSAEGTISESLSVAKFTIPGVLLGGQIGPKLQKILPETYLKYGLAGLFVFISLLMGYSLWVQG